MQRRSVVTRGDRREAVRKLLFSRATIMGGMAELAKDGGEEVYTSMIADRFENALDTLYSDNDGPDGWTHSYNHGQSAATMEEIGSGLNEAYAEGGETGDWESPEETVARIVALAVKQCRPLVPAVGAYQKRWEIEDWRRDRPGFDASAKGAPMHFHDVVGGVDGMRSYPTVDVRPQLYQSEVSLYSKLDRLLYEPDQSTGAKYGYSIGVGPAPRSSMVEPTNQQKARDYMDKAVFDQLFDKGGEATNMMGPPMGLGSIRKASGSTTAEDRVDEFMKNRDRPGPSPYAVDGLDSVSVISRRFA